MKHLFSYYYGRKVLVTGGAGFIGSSLVEALVEAGAEVSILDDFSTGSLTHIAAVANKITLIGGSITDFSTCLRACTNQTILFHCAAQTSVPQSMENPLLCYNINVQGTYNLLQAAKIQGIQRFVFSSSSAVYGQQEGKCSEHLTGKPTSIYGVSKLLGEQLCNNYHDFFGLETVALRYFNVYGDRQNALHPYAAARAKFMHQMRLNKPIIMYGDGLQTRDFVPVEEVVIANLAVGQAPSNRVSGHVFNVASGKSISLLELVEVLRTEYPAFNQEIFFEPARPGDIHTIEADCSKLQSLLSVLSAS